MTKPDFFFVSYSDGTFYKRPEQRTGLGRGSKTDKLTVACLYDTEKGAQAAVAKNAPTFGPSPVVQKL